MLAIRIREPGGPDVLAVEEVPEPQCGPDQIKVDVRAVGVNRADILQRMGHYPAPSGVRADVPGLEFAGEVCEVGAAGGRWGVGDRVMGLVPGAAYAQKVVIHGAEALPVPDALTWQEAAAIPEAFMTAWDALFVQGGLAMGQTALIHAVGSGVGTAALQLVAAAGAMAIGTSRTAAKLARAEELGLAAGVLVKDGVFAKAVLEHTGGRGVDVVLDLVGGGYLPEDLGCMVSQGRLLLVGLLAGRSATVPLGVLLTRRLRVLGTVLRSRRIEEKITLARGFEAGILPLFRAGRLQPVIHHVYDMADVASAHRQMQNAEVFGKIVLTW